MKDDRDKNFVAKNSDGVTVNRWMTHRLPRRFGVIPTRRRYLTHKVVRSTGHAGVRQPGACLTRPDGGQSGPDVRPRRDDQFTGSTSRTPIVVLVMGGNAAEAHPCGFKWVTEAKAQPRRELIVVDPRFTRTASVADFYAPIRPGTDIAFLGGRHQLPARRTTRSSTSTSRPTPTPLHRQGRLRLRGRPLLRLRRGEAQLRQDHLGLRDRRRRLSPKSTTRCSIRAASCNLLKQHYRALHAGAGRAHLRHAEGQVPQGLRDDRRRPPRRPRDDDRCTRSAGPSIRRARRTSAPWR